jgi:hypothetical protein
MGYRGCTAALLVFTQVVVTNHQATSFTACAETAAAFFKQQYIKSALHALFTSLLLLM